MPCGTYRTLVIALCVAFYLCTCPAEGYIRRRSVKTSKSAESKLIGDDDSLPNFQARPFDGGLFQWEVLRENGDDFLEANFTFKGDYYAAVGISSKKKMRGPIILCYVNSTVQAESYATCLDYHGGDYDMQRAPSYTDMRSASVSSTGEVSLSFRRLVRRNNHTNIDFTNATVDDGYSEPKVTGQEDYDVHNPIPWGLSTRVIFSKGKFLDNAKRPKQHDAEDVKVLTVNWNTGVVTMLEATRHAYVLGASAGALVVMLLGGFIIQRFPSVLPEWTRYVGMAVVTLVFTGFCVAYSVANYLDYKDTVTSKAHVRALGDGAAFAFVCMMICVSRRLVMETCFGVSAERAVLYHGICCGVFFVVSTAHAIGMLYFYGIAWSIRWREKDNVSKLPGIIGYVLCVPVIVFGMLRNNSAMMWKLYKNSHFLHVPIIFFLCCHYRKLVYGLIAPAVLVILDIVLERFALPFEEEADVIAVVDAASQCTILRVYTARHVHAGQWFRVQLPAVSRDYHPFFVAVPLFYDNDDPYLEFIIKATPDVVDRQWSVMDRSTAEASKESGGGHHALVEPSWTSRLYHLVLTDTTPIEHVRLRGPCGSPVVNAIYAENVLFVAGGVGIAPILGQLTALTCGYNGYSIEVGRQHVICLVWVIPNNGLLNIYGHFLAQCKMFLKLINPKMAVSFKIYVTGSRGKSCPVNLPAEVVAELCIVQGKRPDIPADATGVQELISANASWSKLDDGKIESSSDRCAVYMCGPDDLISSVSTVFDETNKAAATANAARDPTKQRAMTHFVLGIERFTL